ncbi:MAG: glycoside hydrolase family 78 protein [Puniceicoccales bacterium]|jgi:alpha-L-rhamnosidase|nr:glycoside hydrolase family 78 protein [Puniceicoccales bacterium]
MKTVRFFAVGVLALGVLAPALVAQTATQNTGAAQNKATQNAANKLRCEYLDTPLGIDTATPRLTWQMHTTRQGARQSAYQILVATKTDLLQPDKSDVWNSTKTTSDTMRVHYAGKTLHSFTKYYWTVRVWDESGTPSQFSKPASFETAMLRPDDWRGTWLSDGHDTASLPAAFYRRKFAAPKEIASARAYVAAGGLYELHVNGEKVSDRLLEPAYTRYDRRNLYTTYDVTQLLHKGHNALGVWLGNGWYNFQSKAAWDFHLAPWRNRPRFCLDLRIEYKDGSVETIASDSLWKTAESPLLYNSFYTGERYDARRELPGWDTPSFNDAAWRPATPVPAPSQKIIAQQLHPIRAVKEYAPSSVKKINPLTWLFTFDENIAGVSRLKISGPAGTVVELKHGEQLNKNGLIDNRLIAQFQKVGRRDPPDPFQVDKYILSGKGTETFSARFGYKGFRYVEIHTSIPLELTAQNLTSIAIHTDVPLAGGLKTSDELVNKIFAAANVTYLNNLHGIPTDCPHREKNGWTGDAHLLIETALYNYDAITVYEKWMNDHLDAQRPDGTLPGIIPATDWGYKNLNGVDWVSTIAIIPWQLYLFYGDKTVLERTYDALKLYVTMLEKRSNNTFLTNWALGDWNTYKTRSNKEFISSLYYFLDAKILSQEAHVLGKKEDAVYYAALAEKIKSAINKKFFDSEKNIYARGSQTELSAALMFDIVPAELRPKVAARLAEKVHSNNDHLDVGMLGSKTLFNALSENGSADLAFTVLTQKTHPSLGYYISIGGTTLYEEWLADTRRLSSLNHPCWGECSAWMYKCFAGIFPDPAAPGFKNIILKPVFVRGLDWAEAWHETPFGKVESAWKRENGRVTWRVRVPPNATATVFLPSGEKRQIASGAYLFTE